jgi:hypothetical protein
MCLNCIISDKDELYLDIKILYLTDIFWELFFAIPFTLYYIWILTAMLEHTRSQAYSPELSTTCKLFKPNTISQWAALLLCIWESLDISNKICYNYTSNMAQYSTIEHYVSTIDAS